MNPYLISGVTGQDGVLLARHLLDLGHAVIGLSRSPESARQSLPRDVLTHPYFQLFPLDSAQDHFDICAGFFDLGAPTFVEDSWKDPMNTLHGVAQWSLAACQHMVKTGRTFPLFHASSSEIFGGTTASPQDEGTPMCPRNPYGSAKCAARMILDNFRTRHRLPIYTGILYTHESHLRPDRFVTMKIAKGLLQFQKTGQSFQLGDTSARRAWGLAHQFVKAMSELIHTKQPNDYIFCAPQMHSLKSLVEALSHELGLSTQWRGNSLYQVSHQPSDQEPGKLIASVDPALVRPSDAADLISHSTRLSQVLGWGFDNPLPALAAELMKGAQLTSV